MKVTITDITRQCVKHGAIPYQAETCIYTGQVRTACPKCEAELQSLADAYATARPTGRFRKD